MPTWRRDLARELSRQNRLSVVSILQEPAAKIGTAERIGITGPPGAGKSSLIAAVAQRRLDRGREIGVLAVDPTSPVSQGSLLGDRIRMDSVAYDERLLIRSVPSGSCHNGLCQNVVGMLDTMEAAGFSDLILETVGVGQVSYEARKLVDTLVLVLVPESGDTIQAMKAGALEMADIYVINKADLPAAERLAQELRGVLYRQSRADGWICPIILTSVRDGRGIEQLDAAIDQHRSATRSEERTARLQAERRRYQLRALLVQRLDELINADPAACLTEDLKTAFGAVLSRMPVRALDN